MPFVFDIAAGVRRGNEELKTAVDDFLERRREEIAAILDEYGVPRVGGGGAAPAAAGSGP
jgi:mxaJ protein